MLIRVDNRLDLINEVLSRIEPSLAPMTTAELAEILHDWNGDYELDKIVIPTFVSRFRECYPTDIATVLYDKLWRMINECIPSFDFEALHYTRSSITLYGGYYGDEPSITNFSIHTELRKSTVSK